MSKVSVLFICAVFLCAIVPSCFAADIVTVPTANQLKQGEIDTAFYYINLDNPSGDPQYVQVQTVYLGLTDRLELDLHRYDFDLLGDDMIVNATYSLIQETPKLPDLVVGGRNITETMVGGIAGSEDVSWFVTAAKTLNLPEYGSPSFPVMRLHLGIGNKDHTFLDEDRHNGVFGGVQILLRPGVEIIALNDVQDTITGITVTPNDSGLTLKGGTFGNHVWVGASWAGKM